MNRALDALFGKPKPQLYTEQVVPAAPVVPVVPVVPSKQTNAVVRFGDYEKYRYAHTDTSFLVCTLDNPTFASLRKLCKENKIQAEALALLDKSIADKRATLTDAFIIIDVADNALLIENLAASEKSTAGFAVRLVE